MVGETVYRVRYEGDRPVIYSAVFLAVNRGWRTYRGPDGEWKENGSHWHPSAAVALESEVAYYAREVTSPLISVIFGMTREQLLRRLVHVSAALARLWDTPKA